MALSKVTYTATASQTVFSFSGLTLLDGVADSSELGVYVDGVKQTLTTDYTVGGTDVTFVTGRTAGEIITLARETQNTSRYVDYTNNAFVEADDLDLDSNQLFFLIQENIDGLDDAMVKDPGGSYWEAQGLEIRNAAAGTTSSSLVTVAQLNSAVAGVPSVTLGDGYVWTFTGDASTTTFSLASSPASLSNVNQLFVSVSGVVQRPGTDFTLTTGSPASIVFTTAPPVGTNNVLVQIVTGDIVGVTIPDGSIQTADIADDAVTLDKLDFDAGVADRFIKLDVSGNPSLVTLTTSVVSDFDTAVEAKRLDQFANPAADLNLASLYRIRNLADGASGTKDACTVDQMETEVASEIAGIGNTRVATGSTTLTGTTYAVSSLAWQPSAVLIMSNEGGTDYCHMWTANATWGSWTLNITSNGFSISGVDSGQPLHWVAVRSS